MENKVLLIDYNGGDKNHCLSAWQSTTEFKMDEIPENPKERIDWLFTKSKEGKKKSPEDLLKYLAEHGHHTPFEKSMICFAVTTDIASHIHILKHRIGVSANAESARYKEFIDDKWYIPVDWPEDMKKDLEESTKTAFIKYHDAIDRLVDLGFSRSRAKESARFYLPYNTQITMDLQFNFRSFMHFIDLRNSQHAQKEIRDIASSMLEQLRAVGDFDLSLRAFNK